MIHSKELSLKSIIGSKEGIHLTTYLQNQGSIVLFKRQIHNSIITAKEHLSDVMPEDQLARFIAPLNQLLHDSNILKNFKSNVGLFRTRDSFRMLSIPVDVEPLSVVATSFHVKPLLRWLQADKEFLLLGIGAHSASLFAGSRNSFRHVDTLLFSDVEWQESTKEFSILKNRKIIAKRNNDIINSIDEWLYEITKNNNASLFVAGKPAMTKKLLKKSSKLQVHKEVIKGSFNEDKVGEIIQSIRQILKDDARGMMEKSLVEFYWAEEMNLGKKNIFQIAKEAVRGRIRKLIVADGIQIFGKLDKITGGLSINPIHLDHEDDDLLDDLAQTVIASGGEVVVMPKDHIPKGRPILAILREDTGSSLRESKHQVTEGARNFS